MLGRLEVNSAGSFTIRYDLNERPVAKIQRRQNDAFAIYRGTLSSDACALGPREQPEVRMRAPTLWAALNLASEGTGGTKPTVLISIAQSVDAFSESCLDLLDGWQNTTLPRYFEAEGDGELLSSCLASMADYFSEESFEYRLLARGIAVHHGKLPPPIARQLKRLIDRGRVRVIIATSTLSEGVNIPVNYILIPSVFRGQTRFELQEFSNLIGRAGRPGVATEGHALVVLAEDAGSKRQRGGYEELRDRLEQATQARPAARGVADSALAALLRSIEREWHTLTQGGTQAAFERWLSETVVTSAPGTPAILNLDALDYFLLTALGEVEQLRNAPLENAAIEGNFGAFGRQLTRTPRLSERRGYELRGSEGGAQFRSFIQIDRNGCVCTKRVSLLGQRVFCWIVRQPS